MNRRVERARIKPIPFLPEALRDGNLLGGRAEILRRGEIVSVNGHDADTKKESGGARDNYFLGLEADSTLICG